MKSYLISKRFPVLDHGHVALVDYMGDDGAIVDAARTSYQQGTTRVQDDRHLLRYLFRNRHSSPFESCMVKLHVKLPIFVERQWARHRTAGWNEVSARYSELPEEFYVPAAADISSQSKINKQGRDVPMDTEDAEAFREAIKESCHAAFKVYHASLKLGVARELARINLPLGTYTEKVWWMNLKNLLDFLALRMDAHAQWEIRQYAEVIGRQIVSALFPWTWEAFCDYRLHAMYLSGPETNILTELVKPGRNAYTPLTGREAAEFKAKLARLGVSA